MYKSRLQELCHQKFWTLPRYSCTRDGPDHIPSFKASVIVNGVSFESTNIFKSSKEAHNDAAKVAFENLTSPVSQSSSRSTEDMLELKNQHAFQNGVSSSLVGEPYLPRSRDLPSTSSLDNEHNKEMKLAKESIVKSSADMPSVHQVQENARKCGEGKEASIWETQYKTQLLEVLRKRNLGAPVYSYERKGQPHDPRFKATVTVNDETFESPDLFRTAREAERAAAKVAFESLSNKGIREDESSCCNYKSLLQEMVQKRGHRLPSYNTTRSGASNLPTFVSKVEIEGEFFTGQAAKTKKQAEIDAARVAWSALKERNQNQNPASLSLIYQAQEALARCSSVSQSIITIDLSKKPGASSCSLPGIGAGKDDDDEDDDESAGKISGTDGSGTCPLEGQYITRPNVEAEPSGRGSFSAEIYSCLRDPFIGEPLDAEESTMSSSPSARAVFSSRSSTCTTLSDRSVANINAGVPVESTSSSKQCNRVLVFPHVPNMELPEGTALLPYSDNKWVAAKPSQEGQ